MKPVKGTKVLFHSFIQQIFCEYLFHTSAVPNAGGGGHSSQWIEDPVTMHHGVHMLMWRQAWPISVGAVQAKQPRGGWWDWIL